MGFLFFNFSTCFDKNYSKVPITNLIWVPIPVKLLSDKHYQFGFENEKYFPSKSLSTRGFLEAQVWTIYRVSYLL